MGSWFGWEVCTGSRTLSNCLGPGGRDTEGKENQGRMLEGLLWLDLYYSNFNGAWGREDNGWKRGEASDHPRICGLGCIQGRFLLFMLFKFSFLIGSFPDFVDVIRSFRVFNVFESKVGGVLREWLYI